MSTTKRIVVLLFAVILLASPFVLPGCLVHDDGWYHDHHYWRDGRGWHHP